MEIDRIQNNLALFESNRSAVIKNMIIADLSKLLKMDASIIFDNDCIPLSLFNEESKISYRSSFGVHVICIGHTKFASRDKSVAFIKALLSQIQQSKNVVE